MNKQLKQLLTGAAVVFCFIVGLLQAIAPALIGDTLQRLFGAVIVIICIPFGAGLYNIYKGKKFFDTFLDQ